MPNPHDPTFGPHAVARRSVAIVLSLGLLAALVAIIDGEERFSVFAERPASRIQENLEPLTCSAAIATAGVFGIEVTKGGRTLVIESDSGARRMLAGYASANSNAVPLATLLVVGACMAGSAWGLGWIRRIVLLLLGIIAPSLLLPILNGVWVGAGMFLENRAGAANNFAWRCGSDLALYLTASITVALWWAVRKVAVDDPVASPPPDAVRLSAPASPLAWISAIAVMPALALVIARFACGQQWPWKAGTFDRADGANPICLILGVLAGVGACVMLWRSVVSRSCLARWAWAPLLAFLMAPGSGVLLAALFICVGVSGTDSWQLARANHPVSELDWQRIRIRSNFPLAPVAFALFLIAIGGGVGTLAILMNIEAAPLFYFLRRPIVFWPVAVGAVFLGAWDIWAWRRCSGHAVCPPSLASSSSISAR